MNGSSIAERAQARLGTTLRGKYRLDQVLGIGGMAVVYAATHRNAKRFAVKMLHAELSMSADVRLRFMREGYAANSVDHRGTVVVLDDDVTDDGVAFIVMELLDGMSVEALWESCGRTLPVQTAVAILDQVLDVLAAAHRKGIVHRDIKPANLFVVTDGTVKVLDFGIARARDVAAHASSAGTGTGMLLGTPAFMPPEQAFAKSSEIDGQSDVWAAAATLFTLLTGQFVHQAENAPQLLVKAATERARSLKSVVAGVPEPIARVVDRGLAFEKRERFATVSAMRDALREACRATLGGFPGNVSLRPEIVGRLGSTLVAPAAHEETGLAPWLSQTAAAGLGGTTAQPISADPRRAVAAQGRPAALGARVLIPGAGALALLAVLGAWGIHAARVEEPPPAHSRAVWDSAIAFAPDASSYAFAAEDAGVRLPSQTEFEESSSADAWPSPGTSPALAPSPGTSPDLPPSPPLRSSPSRLRARPAAVPGPPSPSATAGPASCATPFYFDARGNRVFKPECL